MKKNMIMGLAAFLAVICFTGCAKKAGSDEVILTESEPIVIATEPEPIVLEDETEEETKPEPEVYAQLSDRGNGAGSSGKPQTLSHYDEQ